MAKRAINWVEIEARYKTGERPSEIAKDFRNCSGPKISQKATRAGWTQQREEIRNTVVESVAKCFESEVKTNATLAIQLEQQLLEQQLRLVQEGKEFFDFLRENIRAYAEETEEKPLYRRNLILKLEKMYDSILGRFLPSNVVTAAFKTARMVNPDEEDGDEQVTLTIKKQGQDEKEEL